jgi:AcrR family transcriptional regulator
MTDLPRLDRRRRRAGDERRAALLEAIDELLVDNTLDEINVADISRRAGVTRSGFYFYFENKAAAVGALLDDLYADAEGGTDLLVAAEGDPESRIGKVIESLFDAVDRKPHAYRAMLAARATSSTVREVWDSGRAVFAGQVAGMIREERRARRAPAGADADALATVLLELNDRALEAYALGAEPPRAQRIEALTSIWLRSIYVRTATSSERSATARGRKR